MDLRDQTHHLSVHRGTVGSGDSKVLIASFNSGLGQGSTDKVSIMHAYTSNLVEGLRFWLSLSLFQVVGDIGPGSSSDFVNCKPGQGWVKRSPEEAKWPKQERLKSEAWRALREPKSGYTTEQGWVKWSPEEAKLP